MTQVDAEKCPKGVHPLFVQTVQRPRPEFTVGSSPVEELLHPYQREAVAFWRRFGRVMFAMEMGLGKTITAIACADAFLGGNPSAGPVLVVCPSPLKLNWKSEITRFAPARSNVCLLKTGKTPVDYEADYLVVSYSLVSKFTWSKKFRFIVCDESHLIKTMSSKRSKTVRKLCRTLDPVLQSLILLSGTPSSRTKDLYAQLKCLAGRGVFPEFFPVHRPQLAQNAARFYFAQRYCRPQKVFIGHGQHQFTFKGSDNQEELHAMTSVFIYRRTKTEVLTQLPSKLRKRVVIKEFPKKHFEDVMSKVEQTRELKGATAAGLLISQMTRTLAPVKVKAAIGFLKLLQFDKVLLFAHHHQVLDTLEAYCRAIDPEGFIRIDGRVSMKKRAALVARFQTDPRVTYAVLSIKAAGTGLNLFAGNTVVFVELLWNVKDMLQSEDRAHRLGQTKPVTVYYLLINNSVDSLMWQSLNSQVKNMSLVVDNKPNHYLLSAK